MPLSTRRLPAFQAALAMAALLGIVCVALPACSDDADPVLTKKSGSGKGGEGGSGVGGGAGGAGGAGKPQRVFDVAGACTSRQMPIEIDKKTYAIDCDVWRGPDAAYRVFAALDTCCSAADRANSLYPSFTPQGKLVYQIIAVLHQQDADEDLITVDLPGTVACEAAVNAALPKIMMCQGGVDLNAILGACSNLVFGKVPVGGKCPDTDSCIAPASCLGANGTSKEKGTCAPPGQAGAVCTNSLEQPKNGLPQRPLCADGHVCSNDRCIAQAAEGTACVFDLSCLSGRCAGQKCAPALAKKAVLGEACVGATDCETRLRCVGGTCLDKLPGGEACAPQGDDCRVFCDSGKCSGLYCGIDRL